MISFPKSYCRMGVFAFWSSAFVFNLYHAFWLLTNQPIEKWIIGDWLINYEGGFVRRGLMGEFLLLLSKMLNTNVVLLVILFQVLIYLSFFVTTYKLIHNCSFSISTAFLLFSPAFILFTIISPNGAFRKEILLFSLLAILCNILTFQRFIGKFAPLLISIYIGISSIFLALNHEMLVLFVPYFIAATIIYEKGLGDISKKSTLLLGPAILLPFVLATYYNGDAQVVHAICTSLNTYAPADCFSSNISGAISFLKADLTFAHAFVIDSMTSTSMLAYTLSAILSVIPFVIIFFSSEIKVIRQNRRLIFWLAIYIFSALIITIPLLWVMADYGRIIYIHISCLSLLALMLLQDKDHKEVISVDIKHFPKWVLLIIYICGWRLIYWNASLEQFSPIIKYLLGG